MWGIKKLLILLPLQNNSQHIMSTFIGKYEAKADVKGRIFIPSVYRKILPEANRERVVMRRDAENDCLIIYPVPVWNAKVEEFKSKLDEWDPVDQLLLMQFVSEAEWLDLDSQGRVLIQKKHLQTIAVENAEVLFVGMIDRFAVWSKAKYEQSRLSAPDFAALLKEKMMRK
jgi:MraZ protein